MTVRGAIPILLVLVCGPTSGKDRPRADPAPVTKGCEWAGPGFAKLEGSDTCVKIGGTVRAEVSTTSRAGDAFSFSK